MYRSYEDIKNEILNHKSIKDSGLSIIEGSQVNNIVSADALERRKLYIEMENLFNLAFIEENFGEYLDKRVNEFGVYRKLGEYATGEVLFTGEVGTEILNGTIISVNGLNYVVIKDVTISGTTKNDTSPIQALEVGFTSNMPITTIFITEENINGLEKIEAVTEITGGVEPESDKELRSRFYDTQKNNRTSGNIAHYIQWAKECEGVYNAKVFPLWSGNGTVKVAVSGRGNEPLSETLLQNCREYIEQERPIGATVTVVTTSNLNVDVNVTVELAKGYTEEFAKAELKRLIDEYFETVNSEITYSKIFGIIAKAEFINDCKNLTVNSGTVNIKLAEDKVPKLNNLNIILEVI